MFLFHCISHYSHTSLRKKDCLRRFVVVLTEQRKLKEICSFPYSGLEEEVSGIGVRSPAFIAYSTYIQCADIHPCKIAETAFLT